MRIIIVGCGEVGFHIAQRLASENKDVVVIDSDPEAVKRVVEHLDVQALHGSGSSPRILEEAGIRNADMLLAVTDSDETNLLACVFADSLADHVRKMARIRNEDFTEFRQGLGRELMRIDRVINPEVETVRSILRVLRMPNVSEINEFAEGRILLIGLEIGSGSPLAGVKLMNLRSVVSAAPVIVGAIVRDQELIIPRGNDRIMTDDMVYFVCDRNDLEAVLGGFGVQVKPVKNIAIIGGGNVGFRLAQELDGKRYNVKIIESDPSRGQFLSAKLDRPVVLLGDGTDKRLLEEENVGQMDMVVALTRDDETNVLSSLLAKSLGVKRTIARVNKFPYIPLVRAIGVEHIVSTRLSAIHSILHSIRRGRVLSTVSIQGEAAEALEAVALENSEIVGRPIKDLKFPRGAIILCVLRGEEVIIPTGEFVVQPKDRIIILSTAKNITKVERALMVELEYF